MVQLDKLYLAISYLINRDYRDYRRVRTMNVFDPDYFLNLLKRYGDDGLIERYNKATDPLWFYFEESRRQISSTDISPDRWIQYLDPHPLFDTCFYFSRNRNTIGSRHPLGHYLLEGWKSDLKPSPFFDPDYYRQHSEYNDGCGNPLVHYLRHNHEKERDCSIYFSHGWYLDKTPLPDAVRKNAVKHYKLHGSSAGKSPVPMFDPTFYMQQLAGESANCTDPLIHYLSAGEDSGLAPSPDFNLEYYRDRYLKGGTQESPLGHYLATGVFKQNKINHRIGSISERPVISIIVPVFNPKPEYLNNCVRSVLYQTYPYWELWLVDDCSADESIRDVQKKWAALDKRINCIFNEKNRGISAATQTGAEHAQGDYLGFLDNDDELAPNCLFIIADQLIKGDAQVIYTDEDLVGDDGSRHAVFLKPAFNRALLFSHNYITHFVVVAKDLYHRCGGLREEYDGAQDYDLMLRLAEQTSKIHHIPQVLYHWRAVGTSTSIDHGQKPYAHVAGRNALQMAMDGEKTEIIVEDTTLNYHYRIRRVDQVKPSVTIVVFGSDEQQRRRLEDVTDYSNCTFLSPLVDVHGNDRINSKRIQTQYPADLATVINQCAAAGNAEFMAILGDGASEVNADWLTELVSKSDLENDIAIVCGRISYEGDDGPSYTLPDLNDQTVRHYASFLASASRHANGLHNLQYVNGCDFTICLIRCSVFNDLGGFDFDQFPRYLTMLDLCYRAHGSGKKILYTPDAVVTYSGDLSLETENNTDACQEKEIFQRVHCEELALFDRWYNTGHLLNSGYNRKKFYRWLTGTARQTKLDGKIKLK